MEIFTVIITAFTASHGKFLRITVIIFTVKYSFFHGKSLPYLLIAQEFHGRSQQISRLLRQLAQNIAEILRPFRARLRQVTATQLPSYDTAFHGKNLPRNRGAMILTHSVLYRYCYLFFVFTHYYNFIYYN